MQINLSLSEFKEKLSQYNYIIPDETVARFYSALFATPVGGAILKGLPGVGKTELTQLTSKILETEYFFFQMMPNTKEDDLLVRHGVDKNGNAVAYDGVLIETAKYLQQNPTEQAILVLDEYDKARPSADAIMLDYLQHGRIRYLGRKYDVDLDRLCVFIISNDTRDLNDALERRLPTIKLEPLTPEQIVSVLKTKYKIDDQEMLKLAHFLYTVGLHADMEKIITVQELNQFIKAYRRIEGYANIEKLIYAFLTKKDELHIKFMNTLMTFNYKPIQLRNEEEDDHYNKSVVQKIEESINKVTEEDIEELPQPQTEQKYPKINIKSKIIFPDIEPTKIEKEKTVEVFGFINYKSDVPYDILSQFFVGNNRVVNKHKFDEIFEIIESENQERFILQKQPLNLDEFNDYEIFYNLFKGHLQPEDNLYVTKTVNYFPMPFGEFAKEVFGVLKEYNQESLPLKGEVVYISDDGQMRIKFLEKNDKNDNIERENNLGIDTFVSYTGYTGEAKWELVLYSKAKKESLERFFVYFIHILENRLKSKYKQLPLKKLPKNIAYYERDSFNEIIKFLEKYSDKMEIANQTKYIHIHDDGMGASQRVVEVDLSYYFNKVVREKLENIKNKKLSPQDEEALKNEINDLLQTFPNQTFVIMERVLDENKNMAVNFTIFIKDVSYEQSKYKEYFRINTDAYPKKTIDDKFLIFRGTKEEAEEYFKKFFKYNRSLYSLTFLIYYDTKQDKWIDGQLQRIFYSKNAPEICSVSDFKNADSYEFLENKILEHFFRSTVEFLDKTFTDRVDNIIAKHTESNRIFALTSKLSINYPTLTDGTCTRRQI